MTKLTRTDAIWKYINECDTDNLMRVITDINSYNGYFDYLEWYDMEDLDIYLEGETPTQIVQRCQYGNFDIDDKYFRFNVYGNLESCDDYGLERELDDARDEIAEYLPDFQGDVWDAKLQELIDAPETALFNEDLQQVFDDDIDE